MAEPFFINPFFLNYILPFVLVFTFPFARDIVVKLMPFLAVSIAILLVFMLGYGFVYQGKVEMQKWLRVTLMIIFGLALVTAILFISGVWDKFYDVIFSGSTASQIWVNIILIAIMAGAIIAVLKGKGGGSGSSDSTDD